MRAIARRIYGQTRSLPLLCMHGHIDAGVLAANTPFDDPAQLLVVPDHYVTRLLVSQGVPLESLGVPRADGTPPAVGSREIWRAFCAHWHVFRGTASRFWLEHQLVELLGVTVQPSGQTADAAYDQITERLSDPDFRPRALLDTFGIELLTTTDSATATLDGHATLREEGFGERVVPTFRPDALVHVRHPGWRDQARELGELTGVDTATYKGYLEAMAARRRDFVAAGALATDHGHLSADCTPLDPAEAERVYAAALTGEVSAAAAAAFAGHMLYEMAQMSCEDELVMQLHPGVLRDHDPGVRAR